MSMFKDRLKRTIEKAGTQLTYQQVLTLFRQFSTIFYLLLDPPFERLFREWARNQRISVHRYLEASQLHYSTVPTFLQFVNCLIHGGRDRLLIARR